MGMQPICTPKALLVVPSLTICKLWMGETDAQPMCVMKVSLVPLLCSLLAVEGGSKGLHLLLPSLKFACSGYS